MGSQELEKRVRKQPRTLETITYCGLCTCKLVIRVVRFITVSSVMLVMHQLCNAFVEHSVYQVRCLPLLVFVLLYGQKT